MSAGELRGFHAYRGQSRTGTSADESRNKREAMNAGVLDGLTAGLTMWARETVGVDLLDKSSDSYRTGSMVGQVAGMAIGGVDGMAARVMAGIQIAGSAV